MIYVNVRGNDVGRYWFMDEREPCLCRMELESLCAHISYFSMHWYSFLIPDLNQVFYYLWLICTIENEVNLRWSIAWSWIFLELSIFSVRKIRNNKKYFYELRLCGLWCVEYQWLNTDEVTKWRRWY